MSLSWFRFYNQALNDPKVQRLGGETFKGWVNVLCLASIHDGKLPPLKDAAFALRMDESDALKLFDDLKEAELLDESPNGLVPHNWGKRQYVSDNSTDRVRKHRNAKRNVKRFRNGEVTAPEQIQTQNQIPDPENQQGERWKKTWQERLLKKAS